MREKLPHTMVLVAAVLAACALVAGYNAFYVPQTNLPAVIYTEKGTVPQSASPSGSPLEGTQPLPPSAKTPEGLKVNINTATAGELDERLEGVGPVIAGRIVAYREENGPFGSTEEIKNVKGIGDSIFENLKDDITV